MKFGILFLFVLSLTAFSAEPQKAEEIPLVEQWRSTITSVFGESFAIKLLGKVRDSASSNPAADIQMPKIPVIIENARSVEVYNKKPDKVILLPEVEQKYHFSFLKEAYQVTRQTKPSDEDFGKLMNTLSQGASREGVYHALVLDSFYAQLESIDKPIRAPAMEFALYFYNIYFGKKIQAESLQGMNMYTLKRLLAEKAIEIIDAYGENRDDIEKWYACLSSDLAIRFPQHWSHNLRKNTSRAVHKNWASKAPIQHIKSEAVIKIHTVFNSLM